MNPEIVNGLAVIGSVSCVYWLYRGGAALLRAARDTPTGGPRTTSAAPSVPVPAAAQAPQDNDIAVIAAAVYAVLGAHRILHIEDAHAGTVWTAEGRWAQQTSHSLR